MLIASAAAAVMGWAYSVPSAVYSASGPVAGPPVAGRPAPPFSVPALAGGGQVALAQFAGHPLVITFFSTDCGTCWPDMSLLEKAYGRYRSRGLVIVGVGVQDTVSSLRKMVKSLNVTFPIGNDEKGASAAQYRLTSVPTTVFVGSDGVVKSVLEGNLDDRTLQRHLGVILPKSASAP
jgi:peroxiredoxin